jgi:tetratricopeptide (TPR) repeat protein
VPARQKKRRRFAPTNTALRMGRAGLCLKQKELGALLGSLNRVREIENGRKTLSQAEYDRDMARMGVPLGTAPVLLGVAEVFCRLEEEDHDPFALPAEAHLEIERAAFEAAAGVRRRFLADAQAHRFAADREEAARLWEILVPHPAPKRKAIAAASRFARWALAERLCAESVRVAPHDPGEALSLARLGVHLARRVRGPRPFRNRLEAYCRAHVGNALRVGNDFDGADGEFARAGELWTPPEPGEPSPLDEARLLDLEASLRRDQRKFPEALRLIDRALEITVGDGLETGRRLLKKAVVFEHAGDSEAAIETIREALPLVDLGGEPRNPCVARFNLAVNLLFLDRVAEAQALIPAVRALAMAQSLDLDLLRVDWLEGRLAGANGRRGEAIARIGGVIARFAERKMHYDAALAILDLAALLLEEKRGQEAAARVAVAVPIFRAWGIEREGLASLRLFLDAIEQQEATAALARAAALSWRRFGGEPPKKPLKR